MRTSKPGSWQTATILGLADTFPWQNDNHSCKSFQGIRLELVLRLGFKKLPFFGAAVLSWTILTKIKSHSEEWICVGAFVRATASMQWKDHKPNGAFLNTHLLRPYIHGVVKNTKKYRKWFLPTSGLWSYWFK